MIRDSLVPVLTGWLLLFSSGVMVFADTPAVPIRVVVWDEQQPAQKQAYDNFLGNAIADYLKKQPGLEVKSVRLDDPEQGISSETLDACDVLIWWGHVRQGEIKRETAQQVTRRIQQGKLSLIALHSAHWSMPFIEAMNERSIADAMQGLSPDERKVTSVDAIRPERYSAPKRDDPLTPRTEKIINPDGSIVLKIQLPNCCFPAYRGDGKPSHVRTLLSDHPIAKGVPVQFDIPHTEMYDEHFHVPTPDEVIFEERWDAGERFRSGAVWKLGKGRVFYFRPGHETFDVYKQPEPLQILDNAVRWLGKRT
jgi:trehalose utilization protein